MSKNHPPLVRNFWLCPCLPPPPLSFLRVRAKGKYSPSFLKKYNNMSNLLLRKFLTYTSIARTETTFNESLKTHDAYAGQINPMTLQSSCP